MECSIQTLHAVRNSGISLADTSALMAHHAQFSCVNDFPLPFPTFHELKNSYFNLTLSYICIIFPFKVYFDLCRTLFGEKIFFSRFAKVTIIAFSKLFTMSIQNTRF